MASYFLAKSVRAAVLARDGKVCRCCEVRVYTSEELIGGRWIGKGNRAILTFDHVIPRQYGGTTTADNLQILCDSCNSIKGSRMPNRMIRESCRTSETLDQLSDGAERMFWRLTTVADDYGRFEADPRVLLSMCFPLRVGRLKIERVEHWLKELILTEVVDTYRVGGKRYGVFKTWNKHQRVRAQHSKYPPPTSDNICARPTADVPVVEVTEGTTESRRHRESGSAGSGGELPPSAAPAPPTVPSASLNGQPSFHLWPEIQRALGDCVTLGKVLRLRDARWWLAELDANPLVDLVGELRKAEAWIQSNPGRAPKKHAPRFLHAWFARADRDE